MLEYKYLQKCVAYYSLSKVSEERSYQLENRRMIILHIPNEQSENKYVFSHRHWTEVLYTY